MEMDESLFPQALTFDDVLLQPGRSHVLPADVSLRTRLGGDIYLNMPLLSAAMDTVTEAPMAICHGAQWAASASSTAIYHSNSKQKKSIKSSAPNQA